MRSCSSAASSSEDDGGPGSSGRPFGGDGVWNSSFEVLKEVRRGGVVSSKTGAGGDEGERGGGDEGGVYEAGCGSLRGGEFASREREDSCSAVG